MRRVKRIFTFFCITVLMMTFIPTRFTAYAMEGGTEATGSVMLPTIKEEIISVDLPTVGDESPFDFFIDPQGLLYDTGAVRHGGGVVEEGAYLLFHNHDDGEYDFSGRSDRLSVTNRSTIPVNITITAKISDLGNLRMDQDGSFEDEDDCAIYLAIVDDEGNERVLSEDGEVSVEATLSSAPSEAYTFRYDESMDTYEYVYQNDEDISFDSYSFGLRGECNASADWSDTKAYPRVMVTWTVDPIYSDREDIEESDDADEEHIEESDETVDETIEDDADAENDEGTDEEPDNITEDAHEGSSAENENNVAPDISGTGGSNSEAGNESSVSNAAGDSSTGEELSGKTETELEDNRNAHAPETVSSRYGF